MMFKKGDIYKNKETGALCYVRQEDTPSRMYYISWRTSDGSICGSWYHHKDILHEMAKGYLDIIRYGDNKLIEEYIEPYKFTK